MPQIALNIQSQGSSIFTISPTLSGQVYNITMRWTYRSPDKMGSWYMDLDSTLLGIKIVNGIDLLGPFHYLDGVPPGKLGAVRNKGKLSKPGFFNFGIENEMTFFYEEP